MISRMLTWFAFQWSRLMAFRENCHDEARRMCVDSRRFDHFRPPGEDCE